jgi:hypothetical protein
MPSAWTSKVSPSQWWVPLAFIVPPAVLAWLNVVQSPVVQWVVYGGYGLVVIGLGVRALRADDHRLRSGLSPAGDGFEEVQGIYLGRPHLGPVEYGPDDADLTLVVDRAEPDPGDLTGGPARD